MAPAGLAAAECSTPAEPGPGPRSRKGACGDIWSCRHRQPCRV